MSKLALQYKVGEQYKRADLVDVLRAIEQQANGLTEGSISVFHTANNTVPTGTSVAYAQGDFLLNSAPEVLGGGGSQYIIHGFRCVASGSPGTWVEVRTLTGT